MTEVICTPVFGVLEAMCSVFSPTIGICTVFSFSFEWTKVLVSDFMESGA